MKKLLISLVIASALIISVVGVIAEDEIQDINANVTDVIDISVNSLDYGNVMPNSFSDDDSMITVEPNNNVPLTIEIAVSDAGIGSLFHHIKFDLNGNGLDDDSEIGASPLTKDLADVTGTTTNPTRLMVPEGFAPGPNSGQIIYTAMKDITP